MSPDLLYEEIIKYCELNSNEAIVKKYSRYFRDGYDAYGLTKEQLEIKARSIIEDKTNHPERKNKKTWGLVSDLEHLPETLFGSETKTAQAALYNDSS